MTATSPPRWRAPAIASVVAATVAGLLLSPSARAAVPTAGAALPWLSLAHPSGERPQIVDPAGRTIMLRGANVAGIEDDFYSTSTGQEPGPAPMWPIDPAAYAGRCPAMSHHAGEPPICEVDAGRPEYAQRSTPDSLNDLAQMRALGFNFLRLPVSWSQLEPSPGTYNTDYLNRVAQVVGWAREQGIYVLVDMHQDAYSRFTPETAPISAPPVVSPSEEGSAHADGAPPWAVVTDGEPAIAPAGQADFNAYVAASFDSFWRNRVPVDRSGRALRQGSAPGPGLQDHYIGAMAALARRFRADSTVVGYEIMNEPLPGTFPPGPFSTVELYPFYRRVIDALTGQHDGAPCPAGGPSVPGCGYPDLGVHATRQSFFFEPMVLRDLDDAPDQIAAPFSTYPNLVYAPHTYTHVFTADSDAGLSPGSSPYPVSYNQAFEVADVEARSLNAALISGEYGNAAADDNVILRNETAAQDTAMVGSAVWWWKESCQARSATADCYGSWPVYAGDPATPPAQNLGLIPSRQKYLSRIYPRATAGTLTGFAYHPDNRSFTMIATAQHAVRRGATAAETIVYLPSIAKGNVTVTGAAVLDTVAVTPDGSKLAYIAPTGPGPYQVDVSPT